MNAADMTVCPTTTPIHTHLFLVHDEVIPNITPALDPRFRPCRVFLLTSPTTSTQVDNLTTILKEAGVSVFSWPVEDIWDFQHVQERLLEFVSLHGETGLALNVSDGTTPVCLAAYEVFRNLDKPVYFVHPELDQVVWIHPREWESFDLADTIKLRAFFKAHGMRVVVYNNQGIPHARRELTRTLVNNVHRFAQPLGTLNALAAASVDTLLSPSLLPHQFANATLKDLIEIFSARDIVEITPDNKLKFASEHARSYANGGWLEEHVFDVVRTLRSREPYIQDIARSLFIEWDENGSPVKNEIDIAFLADNRLYLIECKTKKIDRDHGPQSHTADILYKLDTLRDHCGGEEARALLVSYRGNLPGLLRKRAEELSIEICDGDRIKNIEDFIRQWIQKPAAV